MLFAAFQFLKVGKTDLSDKPEATPKNSVEKMVLTTPLKETKRVLKKLVRVHNFQDSTLLWDLSKCLKSIYKISTVNKQNCTESAVRFKDNSN